ncbi:hypothetical protein TWF481_002757 [Arthrobotrys musiformis]|uniref:Uncharacterized protein n=1 Tax=Arthrobotrys musiformis TaxID=47236 RepID=A0AAV9VR45_9PEZI
MGGEHTFMASQYIPAYQAAPMPIPRQATPTQVFQAEVEDPLHAFTSSFAALSESKAREHAQTILAQNPALLQSRPSGGVDNSVMTETMVPNYQPRGILKPTASVAPMQQPQRVQFAEPRSVNAAQPAQLGRWWRERWWWLPRSK